MTVNEFNSYLKEILKYRDHPKRSRTIRTEDLHALEYIYYKGDGQDSNLLAFCGMLHHLENMLAFMSEHDFLHGEGEYDLIENYIEKMKKKIDYWMEKFS